jgi:hypothetical protein
VFFYTLDQIADMLAVEPTYLRSNLVHFRGMGGLDRADLLTAVNIAPDDGLHTQRWRIAETELVRWCKRKRVRIYGRR